MKTSDKTKKGKRLIANIKECKALPKTINPNPSSTRVGVVSSSIGHSSIAEFTGKVPLLQPSSANNPRFRFIQFDNQDEAKRFMISTFKLHVHIECNIDLMSFIPPSGELPDYMLKCIYQWIHSRVWEGLFSSHKCVPDIVREFYFRSSHFVSNSYAEPENNIIAKVRGVSVAIYPREIRDLYDCPKVDLPFLPHDSTDKIIMDDIVASIIGHGLLIPRII